MSYSEIRKAIQKSPNKLGAVGHYVTVGEEMREMEIKMEIRMIVIVRHVWK